MNNVKELQTLSHDNSLEKNASLIAYLNPISEFLKDPSVTEIVINTPGEIGIEKDTGWEFHPVPSYTFSRLKTMAGLIATYSQQRFDAEYPSMFATLPGGERVTVIGPPMTRHNEFSYTIRKPSDKEYTWDDYEEQGAFDDVVVEHSTELDPVEVELKKLKKEKKIRAFLVLAIESKKNIILSGATGSGKTTFGKLFCRTVPKHERLISLESVDELKLNKSHQNSVALFYNASGQGLAKVGPAQCMQVCMRSKPDRVFLAEILNGDEAFYFLDGVASGHPGSVSTMHSDNPKMCIERLVNMVRRSPDGRGMSTEDIKKMVHMSVDVIVQYSVARFPDGRKRRYVSEVYYEPEFKKTLMA
jgi:type IV secretion system protein VirB11